MFVQGFVGFVVCLRRLGFTLNETQALIAFMRMRVRVAAVRWRQRVDAAAGAAVRNEPGVVLLLLLVASEALLLLLLRVEGILRLCVV